MPSRIVPFTGDLTPAVAAFNQRLARGQVGWKFPEEPEPDWLPRRPGAPAFQEFFVLVEDGSVRGAYCLKHHDVSIGGERHAVASFHLPLSEGTIDPRFSLVATRLMQDALKRVPLLFGVGMRGPESAVARLVRALGWHLAPVPFYFKVLRGGRFARQVRYGRSRRLVDWGLAVAGATGLAAAGAVVARALLTRRADAGCAAEPVATFGDWADAVWAASAGAYSFCAVRSAEVLNAVYPAGSEGLVRLRVRSRSDGSDVGWAAVQDVQLSNHEHFGDMRLGTLVDAFGPPGRAAAITRAATRALEARGVDLIVANQGHPAWSAALRASGFVSAPSTYMLGAAPALARLIARTDPAFAALHLNRGDGDGPWGVSRGMA